MGKDLRSRTTLLALERTMRKGAYKRIKEREMSLASSGWACENCGADHGEPLHSRTDEIVDVREYSVLKKPWIMNLCQRCAKSDRLKAEPVGRYDYNLA